MKIVNIEEANGEKKSFFKKASKFAKGFLKVAVGVVAGLYSYLLVTEHGLVSTLLAALALGITGNNVKKLKDLFDNNKKEVEEKEKVNNKEEVPILSMAV